MCSCAWLRITVQIFFCFSRRTFLTMARHVYTSFLQSIFTQWLCPFWAYAPSGFKSSSFKLQAWPFRTAISFRHEPLIRSLTAGYFITRPLVTVSYIVQWLTRTDYRRLHEPIWEFRYSVGFPSYTVGYQSMLTDHTPNALRHLRYQISGIRPSCRFMQVHVSLTPFNSSCQLPLFHLNDTSGPTRL